MPECFLAGLQPAAEPMALVGAFIALLHYLTGSQPHPQWLDALSLASLYSHGH